MTFQNPRRSVAASVVKAMPAAMSAEVSLEQAASYMHSRRQWLRRRRLLAGVSGVVIVLVLWEAMSKAYGLQLILPTPVTVVKTFVNTLLLRDTNWVYGQNVYVHLGASILRAMIGFAMAVALAIPLGLLVGRITIVREVIGPVMGAFYPIPGIAWVPLAILWFGLGNTTMVFVVFITALFPVYFNTVDGVRAVNPIMVDAGRCFGAAGMRLFIKVILPATVPYIITGLRIGLGTAWRMIVAAEIIAGSIGVGYLLNEARFFFRTADLMSAMILISIVGYTTERLIVGTLERRTVEKWEVPTT